MFDLTPEEPPEAVHVLEGLVDDRKADDRVDEEGIRVNAAEHAEQQRRAVPDREQADVQEHVLQPVEKEDHADEEQQMVVAGDHVLGAEVQQRTDRLSLKPLQEHRVLAGHAVRLEPCREAEDEQGNDANRHGGLIPDS